MNEHLFVSQNPDGTIVVTLSGEHSVCDFAFTAGPVIAASPTAPASYTITSTTALLLCPVPPVPPPPTPYSVSVSLGPQGGGEGTHAVTWAFTGGVTASFTTSFSILNGLLIVNPPIVPVFTPPGTVTLAALLLLTAIIRRRASLAARSPEHRT